MRTRALLGLAIAIFLAAFPGASAFARKKDAADARRFHRQISNDHRILHALNRLTFGPRPGDAGIVRSAGLKKWIDLQLHPERIPESPLLEGKLRTMDSLNMSGAQLVLNYPPPEVVRQMAAGQVPYPTDPERRLLIQKLVARSGGKTGDGSGAGVSDAAGLRDVLTPAQVRSLRTGTAEQRLAAFQGLAAGAQYDVIAALPQGMRQALFVIAPPGLRRTIELSGGPAQVVARDLMEAKLLRAIYSNRQLEEVLTDFWFNHFNVYFDKGADRYLVTQYERDAIRPHILGKFRDLLEATAKSPAMLFYLDNWQSAGSNSTTPRGARRGLNENYGRELMELHTLGVDGGYTQKDVTEVARCFTGWTIDRPQRGGTFSFNRRLHDDGPKTVLGVTIPAGGGIEDGEKVLDILSHHPSTAHFISRELAQRFMADNPPEPLVQRMALTFEKTGGDLREVMKTMLASKEFWSEGAYRSKVKSPLEMVASAVRAVNGDVDFAFALVNQVAQLGEPLYRKAEPTGYSNSGQEWVNSAGLLARMNFGVALVNNQVPGVKVDGVPSSEGVTLGSPDFQRK